MSTVPSRRSFLQRLAGSTAFLPAAVASLAELRPALAATTGIESRWELVRQQFPFDEAKVPINAANLCPSPRAVTEQVIAFTHDIDNDCSFNNRDKFKKLLEESRSKVAAGIGADPDEVALVRNTSEANNTVNNGMQLGRGDEVLIWEQNHPTNNVAWDVRAARRGFTVKRVTLPKQPKNEQELVDAFESSITRRTRVLSVTHISNVSGIRLPVKAIGADRQANAGSTTTSTERNPGARSPWTSKTSAAIPTRPVRTSGSAVREKSAYCTSRKTVSTNSGPMSSRPAGARRMRRFS